MANSFKVAGDRIAKS